MTARRWKRPAPQCLHLLAFSAAIAGCGASHHQGSLPYQSDALRGEPTASYQRPSAARLPATRTPRDTGGAVADRAPTGQRRSAQGDTSSTPESPASTVPTRPDRETPAPTPGGAYHPQHALAYVLETYRMNGVEFENEDDLRIIDLYRAVQRSGSIYHTTRPVVGDLVFFHNTYDTNRDGRNNDWYTHVAVVEEVHGNGTIVMLSFRSGRVVRDAMNLEHKHSSERNAQVINARLRAQSRQDADYTQYLAGELFAGFGSALGDIRDVVVLDSWSPSAR